MNVGKSIKVALAQKGMSQATLAKRMGLTHTWVSALANKPKASTATVEALAAQFDMPVSEFIKLGED
jgi:transcriptional regulator with XRE-family HTH domain